MRLTTILILLFTTVSAAFAQSGSTVVFTPESLSEAIDQRSNRVRLASLMVEEAKQDESVARNGYLPDLSVAWDLGYLGNGYLTDRDFSDGMKVHNPHFTNNLSLEAMHMIYSGGAVQQGVKMAELRSRLAQLSLQQDRQQVMFVMLSYLTDLQCLYRQRDVIEQNIALAREVLQQMQSRAEEGVLLENDITRYRLQIAELQLQLDRTDEGINVANSCIATALDYPEGTRFRLQAEAIDDTYPLPPLSHWRETAKTHSLELQKAHLGTDINNIRLRLANSEKLPRIAAYAYGQFNSPIVTEVPVLNKNFMYWGFGVNISYNLSSLYKSNKEITVAKTRVAESLLQTELAEESIDDNLTRAYEAFTTACSQLRTRRHSLELARQNYDVVSHRFGEGMALVTDLVDAANVQIAAQTGVETAHSRLLFCLYRLKFITNTLIQQ